MVRLIEDKLIVAAPKEKYNYYDWDFVWPAMLGALKKELEKL